MSTNVRTSNQSRASTKIVLGFIVLVAIGYFGWNYYEEHALAGLKFAPLTPSTVNLVGVDTKTGGYHIIVANSIAQLVQSDQANFEANQDNSDPGASSDSDDTDTTKKKIPLKEMIQTLQGKSDAVGRFVATLNDMKPEDLAPLAPDWSKADLTKALAGDKTLKAKLEQDLNTGLDGKPLPEFRPSTFDRGITIHIPVTMTITTPNGDKTVTGDLLYPFQSILMKSLLQRVKDEAHLDNNSLVGFYGEVAKPFLDIPSKRQDVAGALAAIISDPNIKTLTALPQTVLSSIQILANDTLIKSASYTAEDTPKGKVYNMDLELSDEGRNRLWQYTHDKVGTQLLLVVDGVAVAAPRVGTELRETHLTIENLPDERIVKDAVNKINSMAKATQ